MSANPKSAAVAIEKFIKEHGGPASSPLDPLANFLEAHWIDSFQFLELISFLNEEFSITLDFKGMLPKDYLSIQGLSQVVENQR